MFNRDVARRKRKARIRKKISGTASRPRMVVFRSNRHLYVQLVDDTSGSTLASSSTQVLGRDAQGSFANKEFAAKLGQDIAAKAKERDIAEVVFDRNGYIYHGRIKALADGAREAGLKF